MNIRLIITGQMRSGTTLLANFLNSQEGMSVYSDFMRSILGYDINYSKKASIEYKLDSKEKNRIISSFIAEGRLRGIDYRDSFTDKSYSISEILDIAFTKLYDETGSNLVGVKRTVYVTSMLELLDKGYKIIYLIRDPRDVCYSAKNRFAGYSRYEFLNNWMSSTKEALDIDHVNFKLIRFEDLILQNERVVKELSDFLNTPIELNIENVIDSSGMGFIDNSSFQDVNELFDKKAVRRYEGINVEETAFVEIISKPILIETGYPIRDSEFTLVESITETICFMLYKSKKSFVKKLRKFIK